MGPPEMGGNLGSMVMALNFRFQFFGPLLAEKWAWPPRRRLRIWGPQNPTKRLAHLELLLGHLLSENRVPKLLDPGPSLRGRVGPPKNLKQDFEMMVYPKGSPNGSTLWLGFETPTHMGGRRATPIFGPT